MFTVVGRTPRVPVLPVSMVMDLVATKIIVCVAMVDCICLVQALHERQARQLLKGSVEGPVVTVRSRRGQAFRRCSGRMADT